MSWTTPRTWVVDEIVTAALLNTHVRDNLNVGRGYATTQRTSGDYTLNSTTWANVDTGLDCTLAAATSDRLTALLSGLWGSEAVYASLDVMTTAGSNYFGNAVAPSSNYGIPGTWAILSSLSPFCAERTRTLVSGDISGGNVVGRVRYRTATAANKTLYGLNAGSQGLAFEFENKGPAV